MLPCADCAGIVTKITLRENGTYTLSEYYQGKSTQPIVSQGKLKWHEEDSSIELMQHRPPNRYAWRHGRLLKLDANHQVIDGPLAGNYRLEKSDR